MAAEHQNAVVADLQGDVVSEDEVKVGVQDPEESEVEKGVVAKALPVIHFGRMKESWEGAEPVAEVAEEQPEDEPAEGSEAQDPTFLKTEESPDSEQEDKQLLRSGSRDVSHGDSSPFEEASDAELEPGQEGEPQQLPQIDRDTQHSVSSLLIKEEPEFMEVVEEDVPDEGGATLDIERQCFVVLQRSNG
ncbi:hypothetical protein JD844_013722 [Phrynosoma platyrhinos]|uniref:Uncharacterized protein n=1 Tax=Phrynosoma platyrhinos TaxID=52577 RepID=A0ABQ7TLL7_PHRPL|nr:hypothetical protein JD844_013722 [Phrynosoma platyrhinos]